MPRFIGGRRNSLDEALAIGDYSGKNLSIREYFYVVDFEGHPDTEVLVTPVEGGVKVVLPNYTETHEDARCVVSEPTPGKLKESALNLIREHSRCGV